MAAVFEFDKRVTRETKTRASFVPNISCVQNQELKKELKYVRSLL